MGPRDVHGGHEGGHEGEGDLLAQLAQGGFAALPVGVSAEGGADLGAHGLGVGDMGIEQPAVVEEGERIKPFIGLLLEAHLIGLQFMQQGLQGLGGAELALLEFVLGLLRALRIHKIRL